ncbi:MAG TPA: class I SAM-dependent methyltransferase [Candidatus Saccharimonadales bacterium]|nr:class I SAM-dependent methyltransferase [Candidatus Saccharimonadales bacterium]
MFEPADPATAAALARLYDLDLVEDPGDLDLYLALADRVGEPILELAAGSGRLAVPLAAAGHRVTAVDIDPAMLERAARYGREAGVLEDRLELVEADLRTLALPGAGTYRLAFIGLNSILLLADRQDQRRAVQVLADHLAPGGLAVVDVWLPDAEDLARFDGRVLLEWPRSDPETGAIVTKAGSAQHDAATGTVVLTAIYEEGGQGEPARRWVRRDRLRLLGAYELASFAEEAGLRVELLAGGHDLEPFGPGAERAVLIAERP